MKLLNTLVSIDFLISNQNRCIYPLYTRDNIVYAINVFIVRGYIYTSLACFNTTIQLYDSHFVNKTKQVCN